MGNESMISMLIKLFLLILVFKFLGAIGDARPDYYTLQLDDQEVQISYEQYGKGREREIAEIIKSSKFLS